MALVEYGNSDSSDYEDDDNANATVVTLMKKVEDTKVPSPEPEQNTTEEPETTSLFNLLPQPAKITPAVIEEDDEFLHKKDKLDVPVQKPKAKITVPSLSDFKDVEHSAPVAKPRAASGKKSGLLSMLPQPKNGVSATTKSLIPHILTQKPSSSTVKKKPPLPSPVKKPKPNITGLANYSDDSDDEEVQNDFFSINKKVELPEVEDIPLDLDKPVHKITPKVSKEPRGIESYFKQPEVDNHESEEEPIEIYGNAEAAGSGYNNTAVSSQNEDIVLDDEAIRQLCGSRGKRKREEIQIVDVNQKEVLADAREWLIKGLMDDTTKRVSCSKKKGNEPTNTQKRKHQITYLAHQAKANEAELQNQWANSRMNKRQTQSKYGF